MARYRKVSTRIWCDEKFERAKAARAGRVVNRQHVVVFL